MKERLFLALQSLVGSRCAAYLREYQALEMATQGTLRSLQAERLDRILKHASTRVPFYRERMAGSDPDLEAFPVLTKDLLRTRFKDLMTQELRTEYEGRGPRGRYGWVEVQTGGSTGVPTTVIHDAALRDSGRAGRLFSQGLCGFPFGVPYFRLWGSMKEINNMRASMAQRFTAALAGEVLLNAFCMSPEAMATHIETVNRRIDVRHMMAYTDSAGELARFAERTATSIRTLDSIMACAGTLTDETRATIERVLGARVHNTYGARDCPAMACECERGGFHVYSHHALLEIVDEAGRPVAAGVTGRILVTMLANMSFPIIRYEIGDMGALAPESCPCGRPFPVLARVEGRSVEFLVSTQGGHISPVYIRHLIGVVHNNGLIRRYQLVQETGTAFRLLVEPENGADHSGLAERQRLLDRDLRPVLGPGCSLDIEIVERIAASESGKFLYTLNKS